MYLRSLYRLYPPLSPLCPLPVSPASPVSLYRLSHFHCTLTALPPLCPLPVASLVSPVPPLCPLLRPVSPVPCPYLPLCSARLYRHYVRSLYRLRHHNCTHNCYSLCVTIVLISMEKYMQSCCNGNSPLFTNPLATKIDTRLSITIGFFITDTILSICYFLIWKIKSTL